MKLFLVNADFLNMNLLQVREMPNVLILPRSADYSEEVWLEIREKAVSILQTFFLDDVIPTDAISDNDEEESETLFEDEQSDKQEKLGAVQSSITHQLTDDIHVSYESSMKKDITHSIASPSQPQESILSQTTSPQSEIKRSRSSKKAKKRHARQKSMHKIGDKESTPLKEDDTAMSGTDQVLSSSSHFASPDDSRSKRTPVGSIHDLSVKFLKSSTKKSLELLKDGCVISLQARDSAALHVSRQRAQGGGWFLDTMSNVTKRDPAAQFLVVFRSKVCGLYLTAVTQLLRYFL